MNLCIMLKITGLKIKGEIIITNCEKSHKISFNSKFPLESPEKLLINFVLKCERTLKIMNFKINDLSESPITNIISQKLDKITS